MEDKKSHPKEDEELYLVQDDRGIIPESEWTEEMKKLFELSLDEIGTRETE